MNCLATRGGIVAVEEPEIHLHADGQRFILDFLRSQLDHIQIFISTHSSLFLDRSELSSIILLQKNEHGETTCRRLIQSELNKAIIELGIRNSDFLFADALIFVEGKTDAEVFRIFGQTCGLIPRKAIAEFIPVGGKSKIPFYIMLANQMWELQRRLPYFYIVDSNDSKPEDVRQDLLDRIEKEIDNTRDSQQIPKDKLSESIYVLEKKAIKNDMRKY